MTSRDAFLPRTYMHTEEAQKKNRAVIPQSKLRQSGEFPEVSSTWVLVLCMYMFIAHPGMQEWSDPFDKDKRNET